MKRLADTRINAPPFSSFFQNSSKYVSTPLFSSILLQNKKKSIPLLISIPDHRDEVKRDLPVVEAGDINSVQIRDLNTLTGQI